MLDFSVSLLEGKRGINCDVRVAVHVVGILNSVLSKCKQQVESKKHTAN